jgi:hypothetical protein
MTAYQLAGVALCLACGVGLVWFGVKRVLPGSRDSYLRRVGDVWRAWQQRAQSAYDVSARGRARLRGEIKRIEPPAEFEAEHAELVLLTSDDDRPGTFVERVERAVAVLEEIDAILGRLRDRAIAPDERRYVRALEAVRERRGDRAAMTSSRAEVASHDAAVRLARMRPPAEAAEEHERLAEAFREYLAAATVFHSACLAPDARRAANAAAGLESAQRELRGAYAALAERLEPRSQTRKMLEQRSG